MTDSSAGSADAIYRLRWVAWTACFGLLAVALHKMSVLKPLDHDEHQFIASGVALARDGWLPYRDVPYHHLPYLSFIYAFVFSHTDALLAAARATCVAASLGIVALTAHCVADALRDHRAVVRHGAAAAAALILISNPVFVYTSGRAWNHDPATLFALAAALLHMRWLTGRAPSAAALVAGGVLAGAAIGTRSSFALLIPVFAISFALFGTATRAERVRATATFAVGGFIALVPVALLFWLAPEQFIFGNLHYNLALNTEYRRVAQWPIAMDLRGKLDYVASEILSHQRNGLLLLLYVVAVVSAALNGRLAKARAQHGFLALTLAAILAVAWSPTPTWYQYFFPIVPFLIIASALAIASYATLREATPALVVAAALMATSIAGLRHYGPALMSAGDQSRIAAIDAAADRLEAISSIGRIATLRPIVALQAGREIYPWLATGPFSWRTAPLVPADQRDALGLVGPDELTAALARHPPAAIVVGIETDEDADFEAPLIEYARTHGFDAQPIGDGLVAWLAPGASSNH